MYSHLRYSTFKIFTDSPVSFECLNAGRPVIKALCKFSERFTFGQYHGEVL